jgi:uncharacterized membrane protein YebE (DUF533 family)
MDAKAILEQLLRSGQGLAAQGQQLGERALGVPVDGPERQAMLSGLGKGALAGGVLGLLLGNKGGRSLAGSALSLGGLAALGGLAFKAYQDWQASQGSGPADPRTPVDRLSGEDAQRRSRALLRAMISAARADGHVDQAEGARISAEVRRQGLESEWAGFMLEEMGRALDVREVAREADSPEAAAELYLASVLVIDLDDARERVYLNELARALGLDPELARRLEREARPGG